MSGKTQFYSQMAIAAATGVNASYAQWTSFLSAAGRLYKYPYEDQLMIFTQRPDATACAEYDLWNNTMGRYVKRGSKGIALLDHSGDSPRIKYVFDVSDTGKRRSSRPVPYWKMQWVHEMTIMTALEEKYGVPTSVGMLENQLEAIASQLVGEYWEDRGQQFLDIVANSFLESYDELAIKATFHRAAARSIEYQLFSRCFGNPDDFFSPEEFADVFSFNTRQTVTALGTAVSSISSQIFREIEKAIRTYERAERSKNDERDDLYSQRGLPDSQPTAGSDRAAAPEQIRQDAQELPAGEQSDALQRPGADRETVPPSVGDSGDSHPAHGTADAGASGEEPGPGQADTADGLGAAHEQPESPGRGIGDGGAYQQLSISLFPTEAEQIRIIDEAESHRPSAFSFTQEQIDLFLIHGGNNQNHRMMIAALFQEQKTVEEISRELPEIYRGSSGFFMDGTEVTAWFDSQCIHFARGKAAQYASNRHIVPWTEAALRIGQLMESGQFATNVELAEAYGYERKSLAERLWYLYGDLAREAKDAGILPSLASIRSSNFPVETETMAEQLKDTAFVSELLAEYQVFLDAHDQDRSILRFHYHKLQKIQSALEDLQLPRREYLSDLTEIPELPGFITDDELDEAIRGGSSFAGGKGRIYEFYQQPHTIQEQADFLKKEYGIGGKAPALSGAFHSSEDHDGKGVRYRKSGCKEVKFSWINIAKRIGGLIQEDRYLTQDERKQQQALEDARSDDSQLIGESAQNEIAPEPDPYRYQVGAYHHFENGFDDKLDYPTLAEAEKAALGYVDGTMEDDRFKYDGAAVYDQQERKYVRVYGDYPDEKAHAQVNGTEPVEPEIPESFIDHFYVVDDLQVRGALSLKEYSTFEDAMKAYQELPNTQMKALGAMNTARPFPGSLDFMQCKDGQDTIIEDYKKVAGWEHPEVHEVIDKLETAIQAQSVPEIPASNYHITDDHIGEGGPKQKFARNIEAIETLFQLERENRNATPEEQEVLASYVGWGGLADAFDPDKGNWSQEYSTLKNLLSEEEYAAARASTLNAHYTSPTVIRAIYDAVSQMGFEIGNILEPSMGIGNFFGMLPPEMQSSQLYGVELDSITGRIAKKLYPNAEITVAGFETTDRRDFYDLAVGNVPFGNYKVNDKPYNKLGFSIHNYFFAKALDQVRPGGVVAFVTSRYTMDAQSPDVRKYLAQRADLLGAIRLPNNAFKANAGAEVVSDILFLQKRDHPIDRDEDWIHLGQTPEGFTLNSYFVDHPEMVLGKLALESTPYGKEDCTVLPIEGADLAQQLQEAVSHIHGSYQALELDAQEADVTQEAKVLPADPNVKNFSYTVVDGDVYFRENSVMKPVDINEAAKGRIKGLVELRQIVNDLIEYQLEDYPAEDISQKQQELNTAYDAFTEKYGLINSRGNAQAFSEDASYYLLCSLENVDEDGKLKSKADMFTKRTIRPERHITSVDTPSEALAISIGERGGVDLPFMAELLGTPGEYEPITTALNGVIFKDPLGPEAEEQGWQTADEYLSGNVRDKLRVAKLAAETNSRFAVNVKSLEAAQPKDLDASEIDVRLGATWIAPRYIQQFMEQTFGTPFYLRRNIQVDFSTHTAEWRITGKTATGHNDVAANVTYGTDRANAYRILEDTLNLKDVRIYDVVEDLDGKQKRVLNKKETTLAQQKQQAIKDAFQDWVWRDPTRRNTLVARYNELFNATKPREYDGSHIRFGGMNPDIQLRTHQRNAIAHVLYGGNTLLAHEVGAGKTFEMAASAMESKRLGLCQKSMFVVPNHLTLQWANEFLRLYPSAKILVTTKKDFEASRRKKFCARIATGDYDAVIIGHSQFERIPISAERQERLLQEQIDEITDALDELKRSRGENFSIKQLEKTRKSLQARLEKLNDTARKDDVITFEQLGVDRLFVDESQAYKNLFLYTKMRNVAGLSTSEAQRSSDMFMKCQYLDEITGGRGVVFASGTPVSNSMTELYTVMRYLQYGTLQRQGLTHFDCWASTFGETTTAIELAPEGTGYRARTRFAKFFNLPELMNMFKEVADIKTSDQLHLPVPEAKFETIVVQPSEHQKEMVASLSERAAAVHSGNVDPSEDNMLKITSDGRKLGLDQRLMNPMLPDDPNSKLNACVKNVLKIWQDGKDEKLTQLLFCDLSTPKNDGTFNVYDDVKAKLLAAGIPAEEVAFIHDADTEAKKKDLFAKVRTGQVRVLLGSTQKMGAGTNVQDKLVAVHHLDVGWRPSDMTQRNGRIIRQGNQNKEVQVFQYVTEGTFDAYLYQTLENKQKFISQIMTSKSPVRSCDDVDEQALSYAEIKALCAGNPLIKEKMDLDIDVARLKVLKADHRSKQYRMEDQLLKFFPAEIERLNGFIRGFDADLQTIAAHPLPKEDFVGIEINGRSFQDKQLAGEAILAACKSVHNAEPVPVGNYRGFAMELSFDSFHQEFNLTLKGSMSHKVTLGTDARGNLLRMDNALANISARREMTREQLSNIESQREAAQAEVGKPFPQEAELAEKSERLAELDAQLNMEDKSTPISEKSDRPSVLADLKEKASHVPPPSKSSHQRDDEVL